MRLLNCCVDIVNLVVEHLFSQCVDLVLTVYTFLLLFITYITSCVLCEQMIVLLSQCHLDTLQIGRSACSFFAP